MEAQAQELIVHSDLPLNVETRPSALRREFITPQAIFYVRTHGTIPALNATHHRLCIGGRVNAAGSYSLAELQARFPAVSRTATLQCAGNRRADMSVVRPVKGNPWRMGAIGNAVWTGVSLADVLREAGVGEGSTDVEFVACDEVEMEGERFPYTVSIPLAKALSGDVLLAWNVNDESLAPEHGFPLRVVVPGFAGVRCVKWLAAINVLDRPSDGYMQSQDYKLFSPDSTEDSPNWKDALTINAMPLNAAICEPVAHARLAPGNCTVRGYAIATGSSCVSRVDVSADGGRTWRQADIQERPESWSWTFWETAFDLPQGEHELTVRAWDDAGQTQPARPDDTWNFKGYLSASWHRIPVVVEP